MHGGDRIGGSKFDFLAKNNFLRKFIEYSGIFYIILILPL